MSLDNKQPYTRYIAEVIKQAINTPSCDPLKHLVGAGQVFYDLGVNGEYISDKKTLYVQDRHGFTYQITIVSLPKETQ